MIHYWSVKASFKYIQLLFIGILSSFILSCDSSSDGFQAAPSTLNGLTFDAFGNNLMVFDFRRVSGDASDGGFESGICNSIDVNGQNTTQRFSTGSGATSGQFDYPIRVSNVRYTYSQTGPNSGIITIMGDGRGDGTFLDPPDFFVNNLDGSQWEAIFRMTFGATGAQLGEIATEAVITGTSFSFGLGGPADTDGDGIIDIFDPDADGDGIPDIVDDQVFLGTQLQAIQFTSNSERQGISLTTQEGNPVPLGFDFDTSTLIVPNTPPTLVPNDLSEIGQLIMNFDAGTNPEASRYFLFGVSSDDRGFESARLLDQGIYDLDITAAIGGAVTPEFSVDYAWETTDVLGFDQGTLTLRRRTPLVTGGFDRPIEMYIFSFETLETGTFIRIQPEDGATGTFDFPFADN